MRWNTERSKAVYNEATKHLVGGVNSPSRSYAAVQRPYPIIVERGEGGHLWDVDGNHYIDYISSFGAILLGHGHPDLVEAIQDAAQHGTVYGATTELEVAVAARLKDAIPFVDKFRFNSSGTEAVMSAIRLARGYTGKNKILKFAGCYHGHSDPMLVAAGSGPSTLGMDDSIGIPDGVRSEIITIPYNDKEAVTEAIHHYADELAAVLLEPIVGNFGLVLPQPGYLEHVSQEARRVGALVIWDEIITAFRFRPGSVHAFYETEPDIIVVGKLVGGGLPIGGYGGSDEIMQAVAPVGEVYQAGTLAGNPLTMAASLAFLDVANDAIYEHTERLAKILADGMRDAAQRHGIDLQVNQFGGALTPFFTKEKVTDYAACDRANSDLFARFFNHMLEQGVILAPSKYEVMFISAAHTENDIAYTLEAVERTFTRMARE